MITRLKPIWLPKSRKRQVHIVATHSHRERVEAAYARMDKLKEAVAALPKTKADDGAKKCRKCDRLTYSNDALCVCCAELEHNSKV